MLQNIIIPACNTSHNNDYMYLYCADEIRSILSDSHDLQATIQQLPSLSYSHELTSQLEDVTRLLNMDTTDC